MTDVAPQPERPAASRPERWIVPVLLLVHILVAVASTRFQSLTYDESAHFRYGQQILALNSDRFDDSKMPFTALNAAPVELIRRLRPALLEGVWQPERIGRLATVVFSALVGFSLYRWARSLYGAAAGYAALGMYCLEPNILAHAGLMTTDIYAAGMITLATIAFWRFVQKPGMRSASIAGALLGLSQLAKYTSVFLLVLFPLLAGIYSTGRIAHGSAVRRLLRSSAYGMLILLMVIVIVNAGFLFNRSFTALGDYAFRSDVFLALQNGLRGLDDLPVPVPYPYLEGLDWVRYRDRTGEGYGQVYLLGQTRLVGGFPGYFVVASLVKVPIPMQIALVAALVGFLRGPRSRAWRERELFLLGPAAFFALYFNLLLDAQIGIRLYLVVFPFLIVFTSRLFAEWGAFSRRMRALAVLGAVWWLASVASYFPHYIPYFNELVWNRLHAHRVLSDSNIDYGQTKGYLDEYLTEHPGALFEPEAPSPGTIIVSVDRLTGVRQAPAWYQTLRLEFEPSDHIAYGYLIYQVQEEDLPLLLP